MQQGLTILFALLGLALGSFGNVLIFRLPERAPITGRSHCMHCGTVIRIIDLVPIVSFLLLRGRCHACGKSISWQYPLVEGVSALLFVFALWYAAGDPLAGAILGCALWLLLLIAVIDGKTRLIPDALSIPLIVLGLFLHAVHDTVMISGMILGGSFFALQWVVSRGKWVGSGDILLGLGIGALLGSWQLMLVCLFVAYILGACVALYLLMNRRKTLEDQLSFGPFLVVGAFVAHFLGQMLLQMIGL